MALRDRKSRRVWGLLGTLPNPRDRVYSLSLLAPFAIYNLALKAYDVVVASRSGGARARALRLMWSDMSFNLGYAFLWLGLFATARRGPLRRAVVVLFHVTSVLVAFVRAGAHQYFQKTGTTLDYDIIALWGPRYDEIKPMLKVPLPTRMLLAVSLVYATLGPWLVTRAADRRGGWYRRSPKATPEASSSGPLRLFVLASLFGALSLPTGPGTAGIGRSFARDPLVNLIVTGIKEVRDGLRASDRVVVEHPLAGARLVETSRTEKRNVVLIHLESTRARSVTPYNEGLETAPFLDELAKNSLLAERAYTTVPNTLKASVSVNCGIEPDLRPGVEAKAGGVPARGLPDLLKEQGYRTVFFQSSTENFENFGKIAKDLGYEEYYPLESMDTGGFERSNYFGYEDDVMLKPSEEWLGKLGAVPFVAKYLTGTAHHDYELPIRYGRKNFSKDEQLDRYLNCLRYQDFFLRNLFEQYKRLGLYEDTIFVIYGDHGEGFGEHGRYVHENNPYEESLRVPLVIHDPKRFQSGERVEGLANHTDILPTVLDLLGYEVENGGYPGYSLLHPIPEERTLFFSCFNKDKCLASLKGTEKYIYHYGNQPDELFDLLKDPLEERNLAGERPKEAEERRDELLAWRSRNNIVYGG
ncbi:MAG: sulfatase-like hydrolase/transferase [Actinomycetota bacterium]|nr:sulfatase-like hydrolase/transferase [Actinomycetota bacterium]